MTRPDVSPEQIAYHEAGHACMAYLLGGGIEFVTLEPDWDDGPARYGEARLYWDTSLMSRDDLLQNQIRVCLAGPTAEMIHNGEPLHPGTVPEWSIDWKMAWNIAAELIPSEPQRMQYLELVTRDLYRWFNQSSLWDVLCVFVDHLLAHETLDGEQIEEILANYFGEDPDAGLLD